MGTLTLNMLDPADVDAVWPDIEPALQQSCKSNEIGVLDITPQDIYQGLVGDESAALVCRDDGAVKFVLVIQFHMTNGHKGADIVAMGGEKMTAFKNAYWGFVLDWLKANGCEFLDAYANERLAKVYQGKFGFDKSCVYVRKVL